LLILKNKESRSWKHKHGLACFHYCENSSNVAKEGYKMFKYKYKNVLIQYTLVSSGVDVMD
jgi:hypothetical protein